MKISDLIHELVEVLIKDGDLDVKVGLINENGDISFNKNLSTFIYPERKYIEITADIDNIKEFKESIKVLYKPSR
jgi:hypothetical protein